MTRTLRLACIDADAPPLFGLASAPGGRAGYEPAVAELVAAELGRTLEWVPMAWGDMLPAVRAHQVDAVLCGQGIIPARQELVDFTRPYGIFHEGILMRRGEAVPDPAGLNGKRIAAIRASANYNLASTFTGAVVIEYESDHVYEDMLAALRNGDVDAVCDDDVVFVPLGDSDPDFELAFIVKTGNPWGIAVAKDDPANHAALDSALTNVIADGRLRSAWEQWLPSLDYPFEEN
ncbi:ABC transporter glutamine-binding protein GlnH precursor [Mycobacterium sp. THAF192]|nr:ABC transporter glutamine-binding protein GlnH precursor [Mycobacterium sp. THAF192]